MSTSPRRTALRLATSSAIAVSTALATAAVILPAPAFGQALPSIGATGNDGGATITAPGNDLRVNLNDANRVISWETFDINNNRTVDFVTANTTTPFSVLNRVITNAQSDINGTIASQSNISVWLVNQTGILFGPNGSFSGGRLVLSTLDLDASFTDANFLAGTGTARLSGASTAAIALQSGGSGTIDGSLIAIGQDITVAKTVTATGGEVAFIAARDVSFPMSVGSPLSITINQGTTLATAKIDTSSAISGANVRLVGASNGGAIASLLNVSGGSLTATATDGAVVLATGTVAAQNVTVSSAAAVDGITTGALNPSAGHDLFINSTGTLSTGALTARDISITAGASLPTTNITATRDLSLTRVGGGLTFDPNAVGAATWGRNISLTAAGTIDVSSLVAFSSPGAINITATTGDIQSTGAAVAALSAGTDITLSAAAGTVNFASLVTGAAGRDISITAQAITLPGINASRDLSLTDTLGDLTFTPASVTWGRDINLTATNGSVLVTADLASPGAARITSGTADIRANSVATTDGAIVLTAAGLVRGNAATTMTVNAGGAVNGDVTIAGGSADLANVTAARSIAIKTTNTDLAGAVFDAGEDIAIDGSGAVNVTTLTAKDDIRVQAAGAVTLGTVATDASVAGTRTANFSTPAITFDTTTADGGNINLTSTGGNLTVNTSARTTGASGNLILGAGGGTIDAKVVEATSGSITLNANVSATDINYKAGTGIAGNNITATTGDIIVDAGTTAALGTLTAANSVAARAGGNLTATSITGNDVAIGVSGAGNTVNVTTITAHDDIDVNAVGAITVGTASTDSTAAADNRRANLSGATVVFDTPETADHANSSIRLTSSGGAVNVTTSATTSGAGGQDILIGGTTVNARTLTAVRDIAITGPVATTGAITYTATNGSIKADSITATNGSISLTAATDVTGNSVARMALAANGAASDLSVRATAGQAQLGTVTAGNDIGIVSGTAIDITSATATAGNLAVTAGTTAALGNLTAGKSIGVKAVGATTGGTLDAGEDIAIGVSGAGSTVDITNLRASDDIDLNAAGNINITTLLARGTGNDTRRVDLTTATPTFGGAESSDHVGSNIRVKATGAGNGITLVTSATTQGANGADLILDSATGVAASGATLTAVRSAVVFGRAGLADVGTAIAGEDAVVFGTSASLGIGTAGDDLAVVGSSGTARLATGNTTSTGTRVDLRVPNLGGADVAFTVGDSGVLVGSSIAVQATGAVTIGSATSAIGNVFVQSIAGDVSGLAGDPSTGGPLAGFGRANLTASALDRTITVQAAGTAQLGAVAAGTGVTALAADQLSISGQAIDIVTGTAANGRIALTANGAAGDLSIRNNLTARGDIGLTSARDVLLADYVAASPGPESGFVRSSAGNVTIAAARDVGRTAGTTVMPIARGVDAISATGNLTINGGDVRVDSLSAGGILNINGITGSLTGTAPTADGPGDRGTALTGGGVFASGTVGINTATVGANIVRLNIVDAGGAVTIGSATTQAAIGTVRAPSYTFGGSAGSQYLGLRAAIGDLTETYTGVGADPASVSLNSTLEAGFGRTNLSGNTITGTIARNAQLGTVSATGTISLTARALTTSGSVSAGGNVALTATTGTLEAALIQASGTADITKNGGLTTTPGDELRIIGALTAGGTANVTSSTHARLSQVTSTAGNVTVAAGGDVSGLAGGGSAGDLLPAFGRAGLTASGQDRTITVNANGGNAQLGTLTAGAGTSALAADQIAVSARAVDIIAATAVNGRLAVTASAGALTLGTGTSGGNATLTKTGATGEIDVVNLTAGALNGSAGSATVTSSTNIRADSVTARGGNITLTAADGEVTGRGAGGRAVLTAALRKDGGGVDVPGSDGSVFVTSGKLSRLGAVQAGNAIIVQTGDSLVAARDGAIDGTTFAAARGDVTLSAFNDAGAPGGVTATSVDAGGSALLRTTGSNGGSITLNSVTAASNVLLDTSGSASNAVLVGAVTSTGASIGVRSTGLVTGTTYSANADIGVQSAGALTLGTANAGDDIGLTGASVSLGTATARGDGPDNTSVSLGLLPASPFVASLADNANLTIASTAGVVNVTGDLTAQRNLSVTSAGGATTLAGNLTAGVTPIGGNLTVNSAGALTLGNAAARDIKATGAVSLTAAGNVTKGSGALTIQSNSDQVGTEALTVVATGGNIALGNTAIIGGSVAGRESVATLTATGGTVSFGKVDANGLTVRAGGQVTASGDTTTGNAARAADPVAGFNTVDISTTAGGIQLLTVIANGAGHDIALTAPGPVEADGLTATRNVAATGGSIDIGGATATAGTLSVTANTGALVLGLGSAGTNATLTKTGATGNLDVALLTAGESNGGGGGSATLSSSTDIRTDLVVAHGGAITATAADGEITGRAVGGRTHLIAGLAKDAGGVDIAGTDEGITLTSGGLARLGGVTAGEDITITAGDSGVATRDGGIDLTSVLSIRGNVSLRSFNDDAASTSNNLVATTVISGGTSLLQTAGSNGGSITTDSVTAGGNAVLHTSPETNGAINATSVTAAGSIAARSASALTGTTFTAGVDIRATAAQALTLGTVTAGDDVDLTGASVSLGTATARGDGPDNTAVNLALLPASPFVAATADNANITIASTAGAVSVTGDLSAQHNLSVTSVGGATTLAGNVTAGAPVVPAGPVIAGDLTINSGGALTLGNAAARTLKATGALSLTAAGNIAQGAGALTIQSNSDQAGTEALTVTATTPGSIALGNTAFIGGSVAGRESVASLTATGGAITLGTVDANGLTIRAGGQVTGGAINAGNAARAADPVATFRTVDIATTAGGISLTTATAAGASHDIVLSAPGAITATTFTATRDITANGGSVQVGTATAGNLLSLTSTAGNVTLTTGTAGGALTLDAAGGDATLGTATAGGTADVIATGAASATSLTSGGTLRLLAGAAASSPFAQSTGGNVIVSGTTVALGTATAGGSLDANATAGSLTLTQGTAGTSALVRAAGATTVGTLTAGTDATIRGTSVDATTVAATSGALLVDATAGNATLGTGTAGGAGTVQATGAAGVTSLTAGGTATLTAGTTATAGTIRSTGADVAISGATATIGTAQAATALSVTASNGDLTIDKGIAGTTGLLRTTGGNGDVIVTTSLETGTGATVTSARHARLASVTATTGNIDVTAPNGEVTGIGAAATNLIAAAGAVNVTNGALANLGTVSGNGITVASGTIVASDINAGTGVLSLVAGNGPATLTTGRAGTTALVQSSAAATVGTLTAGTDATIRGASVTANTVTATGGALLIEATAGGATLGTGTAGTTGTLRTTGGGADGDVSVTTSLTTGVAATIASVSDARLAAVTAGTGALTVTAAGEVTGVGAGNANLVASAGAVSVEGGTLARLGTVGAAGATGVTVTADTIAATNVNAGSGALSLVADTGGVTLGTGRSGTTAVIDAKQTATISTSLTAGTSARIAAADADIGGPVTATTRIDVVNTGIGTLVLGDATGTGFQLSETEVNRLNAPEVALDARSTNIAIGKLAFDGDTGGNRVDLLGLGRIDVTGTVSAPGGSASRVIRFGGSATASDKATIIRVAATATGGGGRLLMPNAQVELRGVKIGVGQDGRFLDALGLTAGATPLSVAQVAADFISNPQSTLFYAGNFGGAPYNPIGQSLVEASSLTVRTTDYALFQNTGTIGQSLGVVLDARTTNPRVPALVVAGPNPPDAGGFAIFGTINGFEASAAALLGSTDISIIAVDGRNTRINGCIVGSGGGGCLSNSIVQPVVNVFDSSRNDVLKTSSDFEAPFDPVVGTNNESLFGDVGTFGLEDIPLAPDPDPSECGGADQAPCATSEGEKK